MSKTPNELNRNVYCFMLVLLFLAGGALVCRISFRETHPGSSYIRTPDHVPSGHSSCIVLQSTRTIRHTGENEVAKYFRKYYSTIPTAVATRLWLFLRVRFDCVLMFVAYHRILHEIKTVQKNIWITMYALSSYFDFISQGTSFWSIGMISKAEIDFMATV